MMNDEFFIMCKILILNFLFKFKDEAFINVSPNPQGGVFWKQLKNYSFIIPMTLNKYENNSFILFQMAPPWGLGEYE